MDRVADRNWIVPILALLLATFSICTSELVIAGLLPAVAGDLGVSIPTAGLLITGYAIGVAVWGPILSLLTTSLSRKLLLCAVMVIFIIGNVLCALAPNYWSLLAARLVLSACHGVHFGVAMVVASRLAPAHRQATAISLVVAGVNIATIIGVPLGTAIGNAYGWRMPFWAGAAVGVVALLILAWIIPSTDGQARQESNMRAELRAAVRPVALLCYAIFALLLVAYLNMLAYIVPFLTDASGLPLDVVPWILFAVGITGFAGTFVGGWLGDRNRAAALIGAFTLLALLYAATSQTAANPWSAVTFLCLALLVAFTVPASLQAWLLKEVSDAPNFASTLMNTASQVGIAAGAALGGLLIATGGSYAQVPLVSAAACALALLGTLVLVAWDRRQRPVAAAANQP